MALSISGTPAFVFSESQFSFRSSLPQTFGQRKANRRLPTCVRRNADAFR